MNEHEKINYVDFPPETSAPPRHFLSRHLAGCLKTTAQNMRHFPIRDWTEASTL